jgi:sugar phosphate isomerase/epimerase
MNTMGIRTKSITGDNAFGIEELRFAKETGFDIIELSFNSTQFDYHDKGSGKYFSREAEKLSIHLSAHAPDILNMASTDKNNVSDSIKKCKTIIDGVSIYGVKTLVIHADTKQPVIPGKESIQMDHLVFALASLVPKCKEKEIYLAVETLTPGRLTSSIDNLITAIDAVNSPLIGICIDTNHSNLSINLSATIIKANRRIIEFHINDNHGEQEEHLLPFSGTIDWCSFIKALSAIGYKGNLIMEPGCQPGYNCKDMLYEAYEVSRKILRMIKSCNKQ